MYISAPFYGFIEHGKQVSFISLFTFEQNKYSVSASVANRRVGQRVYSMKLDIIAEGRKTTEHQRVFTCGHSDPEQVVYDSVTICWLPCVNLAFCVTVPLSSR